MSEYEVMYLKENINFKYEILNKASLGTSEFFFTSLYYNIKLTKPPERKTKFLILLLDCLDLVKKIKNIYENKKNYRFNDLRIFFESYKNSKNIYDTTEKFLYFTNVTDEVKEYFSTTYCDSSIMCFNLKYNFDFTFDHFESVDYGFRVNYLLNDLKYIEDLYGNYTSSDKFYVESYINISNISFYFVFAAYYISEDEKIKIKQNLIELQNYLNPIVEVGFKELIEKKRLNEKYKQILYLTVLKDDF